MIFLIRTNAENPHFIQLVRQLDVYLAKMDGDEHAFYAQFNKIDKLIQAVVTYENDQPVGCGAIREIGAKTIEIKRMYTTPESRSKGVASRIVAELEKWAKELGYQKCRLETGNRQVEAIAFYLTNGYTKIPNYGQYAGVENSICFEKVL